MSRIILYSFLSVSSFLDIRTRRIPAWISLLFGMLSLVFAVFFQRTGILDLLFSALPGAVFAALSLVTEGKLGMADALAMVIIGLLKGWEDAAVIILYALMGASILSAGLLIIKKRGRNHEIPFLPFLMAGALIQEVTACFFL